MSDDGCYVNLSSNNDTDLNFGEYCPINSTINNDVEDLSSRIILEKDIFIHAYKMMLFKSLPSFKDT